jgi:hypothetical protein
MVADADQTLHWNIMHTKTTEAGEAIVMSMLSDQLPGGRKAAAGMVAAYARAKSKADEALATRHPCGAKDKGLIALSLAVAQNLRPGAAVDAASISDALESAGAGVLRQVSHLVAGVWSPSDLFFGRGKTPRQAITECRKSFWDATDAQAATALEVLLWFCENARRGASGRVRLQFLYP